MDRWESSLEDYQCSQSLDTFSKVLHTAECLLKDDLAPFELDWFVQTLITEPISLLDVISARMSDDVWSKVVIDAFKLLTKLVENHYDQVEQHIEAIIMECQKAHDARTRTHALHCICACIRVSLWSVTPSQYISELAQASTCKAPLALLFGAICEHHPEEVLGQFTTIWRHYLILLNCNKNTDSVCKSLLKGVWSILKHFGVDIPMKELNEFYDKLTREYIDKCESVVLSILRDYCALFKEKIASDVALRGVLWSREDLTPIVPVYEQVGCVLTREQLQKVFDTEVLPKTTAYKTKLKYTAMRVGTTLHRLYKVCADSALVNVDVYSLEFELRTNPGYDVAEAVAWCLEANMVNSEKLLQTAMVFYENLPSNRRKSIVVNGLLNAPLDVMHTTLNFLITETCNDFTTLPTFLPLWRDIVESQDNKQILFENFVDIVLLVIANFLDEIGDNKKLPDKLDMLLSLTSHVFALQSVEDFTHDQGVLLTNKLFELAQECGLGASLVAAARSITPHLEGDVSKVLKIYRMIQIDRCEDEALLCECCLALIQAPEGAANCNTILKALEVIFSRKDAEPKTLSLAIEKFEKLIVNEKESLNQTLVSKNIQLIENIRSRKDMVGKDSRILHRDVVIFLGEYFNLDIIDGAIDNDDNTLMVKLKDVLTLTVPNPMEGTNYKLNLNSLLHLAISREHEGSLRMLLNIICANLCTKDCSLLQLALGRVIVALCRATVGQSQTDVARHAAPFCGVDATLYIVEQISIEKSPAVRRMLSDTIESILLKQAGTEANERLLRAVYDKVQIMMSSTNSILKLGALDITYSFLPALKSNLNLTMDVLPPLLVLIARTHENFSQVFEAAADLCIDNIGLFSKDVLDKTINELLQTVIQYPETTDKSMTFKNTTKSVLRFAKRVNDDTDDISRKIFGIRNSQSQIQLLYLWSEVPNFFDLKEDKVKEILDFHCCFILEVVFNRLEDGKFALETHLRFLNQYAAFLLKFYYAETLKHINKIIEDLPAKYVRSNRKQLSVCLTHIRQICQNIPDSTLKSLEIWSESLPIKDITEHLEKEKFTKEHATDINALKIVLQIAKLKNPVVVLTTISIFAKTWPKTIQKIYAQNQFKYLKKEVPFLTDLLSVSLMFLTVTDVKLILQEGHFLQGVENDKIGVDFCRFFMPVFAKYLVKKPFLLLQNDMVECWVILNDVVKWSVRKRWSDEQLESVIELVDQLWSTYESHASFKLKHSLLLDLSCLNVKLRTESRPMRWATALLTSTEARRDDKIALVGVLPGGDEYSQPYRQYASMLPTRLSDMDGSSRGVLRALLDALATSGDPSLLDIAITLATGDEATGWWDEAFTSCMASLARLPVSLSLLTSAYARCRVSACACARLLVPLLRFSPLSLVEQFFASILPSTLAALSTGLKAPSTHAGYRACVLEKTTLLDVLLVLFEKVPPSKIESPSSPLYVDIQTDKPWHLARELIRVCYKLRDKLVAPAAASTDLSRVCREFQCAAYKCMCACVCARRPADVQASVYSCLVNKQPWAGIVDETQDYRLPFATEWNRKKISQPVCLNEEVPSRHRRSSSIRTRVFLRTLSENPLDYDLIQREEETDTQDVELADSSLNKHPCAGSLTALFQHAASAAHTAWRDTLCDALNGAGRNVRWLLAQAVCNCKEELKAHATQLRPALLAVVADTGVDGDQIMLNGLHIDILNTLIYWGEENIASDNLNKAVDFLVQTALNNCVRKNIFRMLENVLEDLLKVYGKCVDGNLTVFKVNFDDPNRTKSTLKLLLRFAKNNVLIPDLLPLLLTKLPDNRSESALSELIGILIRGKDEYFVKLKRILEEVKKSSVSDFVRILYSSGCCDAQQFKIIVDLTQKLPESDKKKCLSIISAYMVDHPASAEVADMPHNVRHMADNVTGDKHFEELFTAKQHSFSPKRRKLETSSAIINTVGRNEKYISEVLSRLGAGRVGRLAGKLCQDNISVRFVECFYLAIYLPIKYPCDSKADLPVCLSSFYDMLFSHLKTQVVFKNSKLREEPWTAVDNQMGMGMPSRTLTKRMVGTLRSLSYSAIRDLQDEKDSETGIDVQVSIEKILDTFLDFAKITPPASMELLKQLLRCMCVSRRFDSRAVLAQLLSAVVTVAPELVVIGRECVNELTGIDGIIETIEQLKSSTVGSEGEETVQLLYEETNLRRLGFEQFVLGIYIKEDVTMAENTEEFTIEGLVSTFQRLSNWDQLTYQEKRRIEIDIPKLWTSREQFMPLLDEYTGTEGWFGQMVQLYRGVEKDNMKWLRAMDRWPRRHYAVSAVVEAMQWKSETDIDSLQLPCDIQKGDCLAEWAARLMLRTAFISAKSDTDEAKRLSRSHELLWCASANERGLHSSALSVIQRNCLNTDLFEDETLQWMEQKTIASTAMAVKRNDNSGLEAALNIADNLSDFYVNSTPGTVIGINKLIMQLCYKTDSLTESKIRNTMEVIDAQFARLRKSGVTSLKNKKQMADLYETAVLFYDGLWDENRNDDILQSMCDFLGRASETAIDGTSVAAVILNRLDESATVSDKTAKTLLAKLKPLMSKLPASYIELLIAKLHLFPKKVVKDSGIEELQERNTADMVTLKKCLQLLCHAEYLLLQFCEELYIALENDDTAKWDDILTRTQNRLFDNEYGGADYQTLIKYKSTFDNIRDGDLVMKQLLLKGIISDLKSKPRRETIRLSHVCPSLCDIHPTMGAQLGKLLRLPTSVVRIEEELRVFTDSIRRPCVLTVVTSDATRRRYLHKNEDLRGDAAVSGIQQHAPAYTVIPLSEDCGLIEFLEDHVRVRDLIAMTAPINDIYEKIVRQTGKEHELILAPRATSVHNYNEICAKIPAYSLRSAIENYSSSVQDFIGKKRRFQETLSSMTVFNWLFGLGDRHLQNMLYSVRTGGIQCIDWGNIFHYGCSELPAARLTRNLLAVCDTKALECQLQTLLHSVRESRLLLLAALKVAFRWMPAFSHQLAYIDGVLQGNMSAPDITKQVILQSNKTHKMKYIELLDAVFEKHLRSEGYSVEEQVSCLLLQCTDPWILSVTRTGWEPWL